MKHRPSTSLITWLIGINLRRRAEPCLPTSSPHGTIGTKARRYSRRAGISTETWSILRYKRRTRWMKASITGWTLLWPSHWGKIQSVHSVTRSETTKRSLTKRPISWMMSEDPSWTLLFPMNLTTNSLHSASGPVTLTTKTDTVSI